MSQSNTGGRHSAREAGWARGLTCSALILAGCVTVLGLQRWSDEPAQASVVVTGQGFTALTAITRSGEESLFFLNSQGELIIYNTTARRQGLVPLRVIDIASLFDSGNSDGDEDDRRGGRRR
ncbi:MAG: hypothetical protein AAF288_03080 [Planctomycetota bacterium]